MQTIYIFHTLDDHCLYFLLANDEEERPILHVKHLLKLAKHICLVLKFDSGKKTSLQPPQTCTYIILSGYEYQP